MTDKYVLVDGSPVKCNDIIAWANWLEKADRHVAKDDIGDVYVSTVFLGLDHSFGEGTPVLYESMVFGGKLDQEQERYHTKEEALVGHAKLVERVRNV